MSSDLYQLPTLVWGVLNKDVKRFYETPADWKLALFKLIAKQTRSNNLTVKNSKFNSFQLNLSVDCEVTSVQPVSS